MSSALAPLDPRTTTSFVGTSVVALLAANLVPVLIGGMTADLDMSVAEAGAVATGMSLGTAAALFVANMFVARGDRPRTARIGLLVMAAGFGSAALTSQTAVVTGGIVLGGVGCGIVSAAGTAAASATVDPDRTTSTVVIGNRLIAAMFLAVLPFLGHGLRTALIVLAVAALAGTLIAGALPNMPNRLPAAHRDQPFGPTALTLAVVFGLWSLTEDMVYSMAENFATQHAHLSVGASSQLLSLKIVGGLAGALATPFLLRRVGRSRSILAILVIGTTCKFLIVTATSPAVYGTALVVWGVMYGAVLALVFGLAARMALSGRVGLLVQSIYIIGIACAPVVGGTLFSHASPLVFGLTVAVPSIVTGLILLAVSRRSGVSEYGGELAVPAGRTPEPLPRT
ncbi:MFS transporter [Streptomyces sp. NPDC006367]|uniref:MFS transporter n=1 Tax=unclassified Streptomyces TaxID=2593676 RepID=UPI0033B70080